MSFLSSAAAGARRFLSWLPLAALILAGEAIFFLPFVVPRVFRPTMLDVFGVTNLQLGVAFSAYGFVAVVAYFFGGPLADRFEPRRLMSTALIATAAGGLVLSQIPGPSALLWLYGYWGASTILIFWAALIRATRQLGGPALQGSAFGLLDGGRGLVAAVIGSLAVEAYAWWLPSEAESTLAQRADAFANVVGLFTVVTVLAAVLLMVALPKMLPAAGSAAKAPLGRGVWEAGRMPVVWLQALIVVCAYVAYKGLDDVSLYARDVLRFDEIAAAQASTYSMWMRPPAAIAAGLLADRIGAVRATWISFLLMGIGSTVLASGGLYGHALVWFFLTILSTSAAVFALRGLYFAIMQEGHIPLRYTGSAVGIVSVIGYTPDVFMGPLMGYLLDSAPGRSGHQQLFGVLAIFSLVGLLATFGFGQLARRRASA
ncbi:MFS transporter [Roseimaritima sediminicola]|uniref:MFS transporter n=1 Tax=Roseimaritima sediminicola TaxID=2662066 RepID=UPI0012982888|nr:MFS transporter [Roseimaritima sediminicola]